LTAPTTAVHTDQGARLERAVGSEKVAPSIRRPSHLIRRSRCSRALPFSRSSSSACYTPPRQPSIEVKPRAATGYAATEAPRGLLYHRYAISDEGVIADANIVPPTSQNQKMIEDDLRRFVPTRLDRSDDEVQYVSEQAIRNYDPCISCATHFLKLEVDRE